MIFAINVHSFIDIITNSSTELFVLDKNNSVDFIKGILKEAIESHNKIHNENNTFDDMFDEPFIGNPADAMPGWDDYHQSTHREGLIISSVTDNSIPDWMFEFIEDNFEAERFHLG